jgi:hypothetical protein
MTEEQKNKQDQNSVPKQTETEKKIQWQYKGQSARVPLYRSTKKTK